MAFDEMTVMGIVLPFILLICLVLIVVMLVSLARESDERRRMIVTKAVTGTFYITLGILIADVLRTAAAVFIDGRSAFQGISSFALLSLIALVFSIALIVYKKKHGG